MVKFNPTQEQKIMDALDSVEGRQKLARSMSDWIRESRLLIKCYECNGHYRFGSGHTDEECLTYKILDE